MELNTLITANRIKTQLENYQESLQHLERFPYTTKLNYDLYVAINDGWGTQKIYIPKEVVSDALGLIKQSLEQRIKELEQQFKSL